MPSVKAILLASAIALFTTSNAHMKLDQPPPYGTPNNSPLDPSGSDYPCKATSTGGAPVTEMPIGSSQQLVFDGSAVHGGGSCQVALTKDNPATKGSKWQVIHTIIGGCPSKTAAGNLGQSQGPDNYTFKIPAGIAPATYTLAWTWFNKVGNREMYMNCASVKVSGSTSKRDTYDNETYAVPELSQRDTSFPDLFLANINSGCTTVDSASVDIPNPGSSVDHFGSEEPKPPVGDKCGSSSGSAGTSGSSAGGAGSGAGSGGAAAGGQATQSASKNTQSEAQGVDGLTNAAENSLPAAPASSSPASSGSPANPEIPAAPASPAPSGSAPASAAAGSTSTTCTKAGESICSPDGKQIGICDASLKAAMVPVSAGTVCRNGLVQWPLQKRTSRIFSRGPPRRGNTVSWGF